MFSKSFLLLLMLILLCPAQALAQDVPPVVEKSKEEEQKAQAELERKARTLLDETLDEAQLLKLAENRALVFATAADLLWKYDEKRARVFFQEALTSLGEAVKNITTDDMQQGESIWLYMQQRQQILGNVARHDPQFAMDLLEATRQVFNENLPLYARMRDQELMLEQSIAAEVAAKDPKRALKMAQESLEKGLSYEAINLLRKLQAKDSEAATGFVGDIIKKLRSTDFKTNMEAPYVAQELLRMLLRPKETSAWGLSSSDSSKIKPLNVDDQTTRELTEIVLTAALESPPERSNFMILQALLPDLEKRAPERTAQVRRKFAENTEKLDPQYKLMYQYQMLMRDGKPEAIVEAAAKAAPEMRAYLYQTAIAKLMQSGDLEGARKVAMENLSGADRDQYLAQIDRQLISRAVEQGKMEEARKLIERINPKEARLSQLAQLAASLFAKGERKTALALLDETQELVNRPPENMQEITAMLQVARTYALIEPARAFSIIEPVIDQANALLAAAALLEKFGADRGLFKNGEYRMRLGMIYGYAFSIQNWKELTALARSDFARTRAITDRFNRDEVRLMARLLIAQAVLGEHPTAGTTIVGIAANSGSD